MKLNLIIFVCLMIACTEQVTPPESVRLDLTVTVIDTFGYTRFATDTTLVDSAAVMVNSLTYQTAFSAQTDSNGQTCLEQMLPDKYTFSATKRIPVEIVEGVLGFPLELALNGHAPNIEIDADHNEIDLYMVPVLIGQLLISEIYYSGAPPNPAFYFHDQFIELYNNSGSTFYLDSLIIADVSYGHIDEDYIHAVHAYMFPGSGADYPLGPGQFVIVAQDAINHLDKNPNSIDLSGADFEYYVKGKGDVDNPDTPNMIQLHHKYGIDFLYSVMNNAIVLVKVDDPYQYGYDQFNELLIPKTAIMDGVEYKEDLNEVDLKRLDITIDAGLAGGFAPYTGRSIERVIADTKDGRAVLMDNNNSSFDFQVLDKPTIGYLWDAGGE
ncbi:MAG: DUF4876 domain-containing protein [Candidatus Marinimicrobia bacterium]|nr:DUF4876 domain-containing protein [Candidatus Neomarinimicrobiota bacterium]